MPRILRVHEALMDLLNELDKVEESELALFVGVWCVGSTCYLAEILNVEMSLERWGKGSREEERGREERGLRELEDLAPRGARAREVLLCQAAHRSRSGKGENERCSRERERFLSSPSSLLQLMLSTRAKLPISTTQAKHLTSAHTGPRSILSTLSLLSPSSLSHPSTTSLSSLPQFLLSLSSHDSHRTPSSHRCSSETKHGADCQVEQGGEVGNYHQGFTSSELGEFNGRWSTGTSWIQR